MSRSALTDDIGRPPNEKTVRRLRLPDGDRVTVRIDESGNQTHLKIQHDPPLHFTVDEGAAHLEQGPRPIPEWVKPVLRQLGLDGVVV